jgi:RNA polymerase primary sigma factor
MKIINLQKSGSVIATANNKEVFNKYLLEISKFTPLSREEEVETFKIIEDTGSQKAIDKIYKHNLLFVVYIARKYSNWLHNANITLEDLVSEGNLGLYFSIARFDYKSGNKFISYSIWWIKQHIIDFISKNGKNVRIPNRVYTLNVKIKNKSAAIEQLTGRPSTDIEVFNTMLEDGDIPPSWTIKDFNEIVSANGFDKSLSSMVSVDSEVEIIDMLEDKCLLPDEELIASQDKELILNLLNKLTPKTKQYFLHYYGFSGYEQMDIHALATKFEESIGVIKFKMNKALRKFRLTARHNTGDLLF